MKIIKFIKATLNKLFEYGWDVNHIQHKEVK